MATGVTRFKKSEIEVKSKKGISERRLVATLENLIELRNENGVGNYGINEQTLDNVLKGLKGEVVQMKNLKVKDLRLGNESVDGLPKIIKFEDDDDKKEEGNKSNLVDISININNNNNSNLIDMSKNDEEEVVQVNEEKKSKKRKMEGGGEGKKKKKKGEGGYQSDKKKQKVKD